MNQQKQALLQTIFRYLLINSSFNNNSGLLNGKMGIVIFLCHYGRYKKSKLIAKFAEELIREIYSEMHLDYPINFKDGFCGIAWAIEYLIRQGFVESDPDAILAELDQKIIEWDVRRISDYTLESGLKGVAYYCIARCGNRNRFSLPEDYIQDLFNSLLNSQDKDDEIIFLLDGLHKILQKETLPAIYFTPVFLKDKYKIPDKINTESPRGLTNNGIAGIGLHILLNNEKKSLHL
ncbi:lanthionine synthetase LanC family protein [Bacteroides sp. 519]|uniref:lanthionine synthetase LanC family protein n=1 Tax=Bacteroides sp. 519 TaxID=2302937 RepID=UPI0013D5D32E|nr:lanthionine synthetase LanC family protein [Bacteroides sp. 519]NDV57809.1 hypothetical protein [Bacteroides sp. 519]